MKRINTSFASDPYIQQPFTTKSLDFLQNGNKEIIAGLCVNLIENTDGGYNETIPYLISSIPIPSTIFSNYYVFFNGELYIAPDNVGLLYAKINTAPDVTADPLLFTDSINRNVHDNRYIEYTNTLSGSLFAVANVRDIRRKTPLTLTPLLNSWNAFAGVPPRAIIENRNWITLMGGITKSGTIGSTLFFTLPTEYRPAVSKAFSCYLYDSGTIKTCIIQVDSAGDCTIEPTSISGSTLTNVFLDGIRYYRL